MITALYTPGTVPEGYCKTDWQSLVNMIASIATITFPGSLSPFNFGATTPTADNSIYPWFKTAADGQPDKWYVFWNGLWVSKHPDPPGTVKLFELSIAAINTLDGGDANPAGLASGPMWERVTQLNGKFPLQPDDATYLLAATGGEATHVLTEAELAAHTHGTLTANNSFGVYGGLITGGSAPYWSNNSGWNKVQQDSTTASAGSGTAHNNMPPWYGIMFARRTSRLYYVA